MKKWFVVALIACVAVGVQAGDGDGDKGKGKDKDKPVTKEQYLANQKKMAEKKGVEFDKAAAEVKFNAKDKNKDGKLTGDEKGKGKKGKGKKDEGKKGKGDKTVE